MENGFSKHILHEGPPFIPPRGEMDGGMAVPVFPSGRIARKPGVSQFSTPIILKMVNRAAKTSPFSGQLRCNSTAAAER